ncbi:unnamed protein product, partial [Chrysoparadoxa australica]
MSHATDPERMGNKETLVPKAFISHTGKDADLPGLNPANFVAWLDEYLREVKYVKTFIDRHIEKGDLWMKKIREEASTSQVMVVVLSPSYPLRYWCMVELDLAIETAEIIIIPVYYGIKDDDDLIVQDKWKEEWAKMQDEGDKGVDLERWENNLISL